jgi:hypothetical protein
LSWLLLLESAVDLYYKPLIWVLARAEKLLSQFSNDGLIIERQQDWSASPTWAPA